MSAFSYACSLFNSAIVSSDRRSGRTLGAAGPENEHWAYPESFRAHSYTPLRSETEKMLQGFFLLPDPVSPLNLGPCRLTAGRHPLMVRSTSRLTTRAS